MLRRSGTVLACLAALLPGPSGPAQPVPPSTVDAGALDRYLSASLAATGLPGMAVAVTRGSDVLYVRGFGAAADGAPVTPRTQFRIASLSKSFTAAVVNRLVESGRVDLDAPVRAYLPEFRTVDPVASGRITVRHLLHQTSGMADAGFPAVNDQPADLGQRVAQLRTAALVSEPGREFHYFDPNYQVLARVVEVVTGQPFATVLRDQVLAPLAMADTLSAPTAATGAAQAPRLGPGHVLVFGVAVARPELDGLLAGSGGMVSTADDMARWLVMQSSGGGPVLSSRSIDRMHSPPPEITGGYGQGWQVVVPPDGPRRIEHNGVLSTFSADQVLLPDDGYGFVLLYDANSALADTAGVKAGLARLLAGAPAVDGPRSTAVVSLVIGGLLLALLAVRTVQWRRIGRWAGRRPSRPRWTAAPGIVGPLVPAALLIALPVLLGLLIGRSFTLWQLSLAMPDVIILLGVAAATGAAVALGRLARWRALARHSSAEVSGAPSTTGGRSPSSKTDRHGRG